MSLRVELFGGVCVVRDAVRHTRFRTQKMVTLLGLLAMRHGRPVPREELAEALWPDQPPDWQRARMRNELAFLTQLLGEEAVARHGRTALSLAPDVGCDVADFHAALEAAEAAADPAERLQRLCAAVRAQSGDLMPGFYEEPILAEREHLRQALFDALLRLVRALCGHGRAEEAARWRRALAARFPDEELPALPTVATPAPPVLADPPPLPRPPVPPNRFYGRNAERVAISAWREAGQAPLLTLTGPAGIGKTRLAAETLPDAAFVPLIDVEDGGLLWEAIRSSLKLEEPPGQVTAARDLVIERLKARETLLLLDNFEQIADTSAPLVLDLVSAAPGTRCVITSRVRLELAGEEEIHLAPLSSDESQALFLDRARAVRRDFPDTPDVAPLCRLMDGLPLVLEIAASRALTLGPAQMREQLSDRFRFLVTRRRDLPARHQSLRAALEWSVNLLPPAVRSAFPLLSVFRGGFTLEAADALFAGALPAADAIETLRAHSLLTVDFNDGAAPRYDLLASVRAFGAERLPPEEAPAVRERHARHFAALVLEDDGPAGALPSTARLALWDRERENLRAILPTLEERDPETLARIALALFPYWESRSMLEEGARWSETAARRCDDPACAAQLLTHLTRFRFYVSDLAAAAEAGREALAAAGRAGSLVAEARANRYLGQIAVYQGDLAGATETLPKALDQFRTVGDAAGECDVLYVLGVLHAAMNRYDVAMGYLGECLALARRIGDTQTALMTVFFIGDGYVCLEEFDTAALHLVALRAEAEREGYVLPMAYYHWSEGVRLTEIGRAQEGAHELREVARHTLSVHLRWGFALALEAMGYNACALGQPERAVRLLAASARMQSEVNYRLTLNYVARHERYLARLREALPDDRFAALWSEGDALHFDDVIHLALAEG